MSSCSSKRPDKLINKGPEHFLFVNLLHVGFNAINNTSDRILVLLLLSGRGFILSTQTNYDREHIMDSNYYVYALFDTSNPFTPFYVGEGRNERHLAHRRKFVSDKGKMTDTMRQKFISQNSQSIYCSGDCPSRIKKRIKK